MTDLSTLRHTGPIAAVAAAGSFIATAGYDNRLVLWEASSRRALARGLHDHLVNHCAFSSDGRLLATASSDYSARLWDVPTLRLRAALIGHEDDVDMAVFAPDDQRVATCALDRTVRVWGVDGRCRHILRGHQGNILSVAWSVDGQQLVSSSVDGTVREWSARSGAQLRCNDLDGVRTDTLEMDGHGTIFAGDDAGRIAVIVDGRTSFVQAHQAGVKKIVLDAGAGLLVSLSYDRTLAVWQLRQRTQLHEIARGEYPVQVWARAAALAGPGRLAVGTFGSTYGTFDWETGTWDLQGVEPDRSLNAVALVGQARYAIGDAGVLYRDDEPVSELGSLCNFLVSAGGRLLTGGQLGALFDARRGEVLHRHHSPLNCAAAFERAGVPHVAVGTYTGEVLIFALDAQGTPQLVRTLEVYGNAVKGLAVRDGELFSVCANTAAAWHACDDFRLLRLLPRAHERIANACCAAAGDAFASVGRDLKLRIWTARGEEVYPTPHPNSVKCICPSTDGNTLMTGAYTGTLASFDMATRSWKSFSRPTTAGISALAYDPAQRRFIASSYDGRLYAAA